MKATYHQGPGAQVELDVLESADGKAVLGREKQVLVTSVPIATTGAPGTCTLSVDSDKAAADKAAADKKTK